jgi:hypothetical protein
MRDRFRRMPSWHNFGLRLFIFIEMKQEAGWRQKSRYDVAAK